MARHPQPLVAGNWKMNGLQADLVQIARVCEAVRQGAVGEAQILVCPPATLIRDAARLAAGSGLEIGGQNCHAAPAGAHTGDLSAAMLVDAGASYVIVGHSERRASHGESNVVVRAKAQAAIAAGLNVILCVGETMADRDAGVAMRVVQRQLTGSVPVECDATRLSLAYEPIWAIGTGVTPTTDDIGEMHDFIRREVRHLLPHGGDTLRLLYGGSVRANNAAELLSVTNVDGALVGGASLHATDFLAIAAIYRAAIPAVA